MLNKLFERLHILFISAVMLIITAIIVILCLNGIYVKQADEKSLFQRLSMFLTYQLEDSIENIPATVKPYEDNYPLFVMLKDLQGNIIYESPFAVATEFNTLQLLFAEKVETEIAMSNQEDTSSNPSNVTTQGGILDFYGSSHDKYLGIPVTLVTKDNIALDLVLFFRSESTLSLLGLQVPFYVMIWFFSFFCVAGVSHFLLKSAMKPTERMLKSQKDFIASASHELKSPLAVILANNDRIQELTVDSTDLQRAAKVIDAEALRMSMLIKNLLVLASSDAGTWKLTKTMVNMDTLLIMLYEAYEPVCVKNAITLEAGFTNTHFPKLYTDQECLYRILGIYMDNAIAHSKHNSRIRIGAALSAKDITLSVSDHGQGISPEDKPYIFDRFYCADQSRTDKSHFGLGLSIAKELANALNGKVGFQDTSGGGATFFVVLPLNLK